MADVRGRTVLGTFFHAPVRGEIEVLEEALVAVDRDGTIAAVTLSSDPGYAACKASAEAEGRLTVFADGRFVIPGLVDLHVHAPQYPQLGRALDVPLEEWLQRHTFPLESRYADPDFARESYTALVGDLLSLGTTTVVYFATVHQAASRMLADICLSKGQRALVGKVAMDDADACPQDCRDESAEAAIAGTRAFISYVRALTGNEDRLVRPVITPRFIPSCTDVALEGLGRLAAECDCHVQTHCSESDWEHAAVLSRHGVTDAASLDGFGLLTAKTILAHCNFLTDPDMDRVAARGASIAHCALSNAYFAGAVFPLRRHWTRGSMSASAPTFPAAPAPRCSTPRG